MGYSINFYVRALCFISTDDDKFAFLFLYQELISACHYNYVLITRTLRPRVLVTGDTPWATYLEIDVHFFHIGSFLLTDKIRLTLAQYKEMFIPSASPENKKRNAQYTNQGRLQYEFGSGTTTGYLIGGYSRQYRRKRRFI